MKFSHALAISRYESFRVEARSIARDSLPGHLKSLKLLGIDNHALVAAHCWSSSPDRKVDWDWSFSNRYCKVHPKAFDLSIWNGNSLLSMALGRPTYKGKSIRMDFIERTPNISPYAGEIFPISQLAYETYGSLIGAEYIRIVKPMNKNLIRYYMSQDTGFSYVPSKQGHSDYLVKKL